MAEREGVIKYQLDFSEASPPPAKAIIGLERWREILWQRGLIGQDPERYSGYGFGNISRRWPASADSFLISGTQTGGLVHLDPEHYALVTLADPASNHIVAEGCTAPSSEALAHGMIYRIAPEVKAVFHVHSPEIWKNSASLELPVTDPAVEYGTPEMADAVFEVLRNSSSYTRGIFSMGGHEDGIMAYGRSPDEAGELLLDALVRLDGIPYYPGSKHNKTGNQ